MTRLATRLTLAAATLLSLAARAQPTAFVGYLDGVHPVLLERNGDGITAELTTAERPDAPYELVGDCADRACAYRAREAALSVKVRDLSANHVHLTLTDGTGRERTARLTDTRSAGVGALPASCTRGGSLHAYRDSASTLRLTVANLAGRGIVGTAYVHSLATSLRVSGEPNEGGTTRLTLRDEAGKRVGYIALAGICYRPDFEATVELGGMTTQLRLEEVERLDLGCRSAEGRYSMLYPEVGKPGGASAKRTAAWWDATRAAAAAITAPVANAATWFVPARLDERVLSGWLITRGADGHAAARALTFDRNTGRPVRATALLGPKKQRAKAARTAREQALARHPLAGEAAFEAWARDIAFDEVTALPEGLAFGGPYHPVYGQLTYTAPWSELSYRERVPAWLTAAAESPAK